MNWIDIKQNPPLRCGNIRVKLVDGTEALTHVNVAVEGQHRISKGFRRRLHNSGEFTVIDDNYVLCTYAYYTNERLGFPVEGAVPVMAKNIVSYYYC